MKILLCEPNVSEGTRLEVVEEILAGVRQIEGVRLLHVSSDASHNRSVFTYLGPPEAVLAATQALAATALRRIDMSGHRGAHPRLGAVDVVPFVPVRGMETAEAVEISRRFGRFVGALGVPVYYYEDAATRPECTHLPDIRRGQYEGLEEKLRDPAWLPDEGPAAFNRRSGALVTGVRPPLVAFNVNLRTSDLTIAQEIARAVRHVDGGFRFVRALGVSLGDQGMVQVSMNLTHHARTPLHRVLEAIRCEAARYGVSVAGTELVGPVPLDALEEVIKYYLQAHDFRMDQIVETALLE